MAGFFFFAFVLILVLDETNPFKSPNFADFF